MPLDPKRRYETLLRINNAIVQQTTRESLFRALTSEILKLIHFDRCSINLYEQDTRLLSYFATAEGVSLGGGMSRPLEKGYVAQVVIRTREPLVIPDLENQSYLSDVENMLRAGLRATMAFPLIMRDKVLGSLHFSFKQKPDDWEELCRFLEDLSTQVAIAVYNMLAYIRIQSANENLLNQKRYLQRQAGKSYDPEHFYFSSNAMFEVMQQVKMAAASDAPVLITGETGTGKEYIAHCIHDLSLRKEALLVKVNCPALAASLFESELFGHAKGAFTGASQQRLGRFEMANGGTIFLDEIGELPMPQQAKMLHVLQDRMFERVGESRSISVDFRVVSATNRNLEEAIQEGEFRSDLYYRLNMVQIMIPALRERADDIPVLVKRLSEQLSEKLHRPQPVFSDEVVARLVRYSWPGNVRELKNLVHRMMLRRPGEIVRLADVEGFLGRGQAQPLDYRTGFPTMDQMERRHLEAALRAAGGAIGGPGGAAELLGMPRTTLQYRLKRHDLHAGDYKPSRTGPAIR